MQPRALIDATNEKLAAFISHKLDDVDLVAMFVDGINCANHAMIIALGVTIDGTKVPLGLWAGSTENSVVAPALLQNLVERGLRVDLRRRWRQGASPGSERRVRRSSDRAALPGPQDAERSWLSSRGHVAPTSLGRCVTARKKRTFSTTNAIEHERLYPFGQSRS